MVVLAPDLYKSDGGQRPFVIVSDENYPFYPSGYLAVPLTGQNRSNTIAVEDRDIVEVYAGLDKDSYANPWSPLQLNDAGLELCRLSESYVNLVADRVVKALGTNL